MGDGLAHEWGVIADPEIQIIDLTAEDQFIVIASDGVWEFLSNEAVAKIVEKYFLKNLPEEAANHLVKASVKKWKEEEEVIDDITCLVIFLKNSSSI